MTTDRGWFRYAMAVVLAVGAAAAVAGMYLMTKGGTKTVTVSKTVQAAPLTAGNVSADVTLRLGPPTQQIPGGQINPSLQGAICDVWSLADGLAMSCHP